MSQLSCDPQGRCRNKVERRKEGGQAGTISGFLVKGEEPLERSEINLIRREVLVEIELLMHHDGNGAWTLQSNGLQLQSCSLLANMQSLDSLCIHLSRWYKID